MREKKSKLLRQLQTLGHLAALRRRKERKDKDSLEKNEIHEIKVDDSPLMVVHHEIVCFQGYFEAFQYVYHHLDHPGWVM